ncbi:MAG: coproporphyrinogen III oxidase family protein, partial [Bacteroidetes bacterium]
MAGIYVHIPYCRKACTYCDFHFLTSRGSQGAMVAAIAREAALRSDFFGAQPAPLDTLYFGGGTPSVLSPAELASLMEALRRHYSFHPEAEVTLEANPDDLSPAYLAALRKAGVNRLSVGIQSFRPEDLAALNRSHTAAQARDCLPAARAAGFEAVSLDLIFGLPGLDRQAWADNLGQALALAPTHISVYALTVEARTALAHQVEKGQVLLPEDEAFEAQY